MMLTAKLAYSQIKINRSRTLWTLIGIILSTALITAVCSFAASGNTLLIDIFGEGYNNHAGAITALLIIPAGLLSIIIVSMSVIVISNSFRVSAGERTAQFGILKSVGATKSQITTTVMYESMLLSAIGIPIGIVVGLILAFAGVQVANSFLSEINSLVNIMMTELIIVIEFVIAWQALIAAALISFVSVLFSAWLPAHKAARVSAMDSIRMAEEVEIEEKQVRTSPLINKLFGFEGTLAAKNMKRSKRNLRSSVVSLTIGVILFICLGALSQQASLIDEALYPEVDGTVMVDYTSLRSYLVNEATGKEEVIIDVPINTETANAATEKLRQYENTAIFGTGRDMDTYKTVIPIEMFSSQMLKAIKELYPDQPSDYMLPVEIMTVDPENYALLCKKAGVPVGSNILINRYDYNDNGNLTVMPPFVYEGGQLQLAKADDSIHELTVHGVLTQEDIPNELLGAYVHIVRLVVPQLVMRDYSWFASPSNVDGFMAYANDVMEEMFPQGLEHSYMELGFTTRVFKIQDYIKIMNISIVMALVFVYCFVALLVLIGLTSVISTMSANVRIRAREFAVLQSVGMTYNGLKRMLNLESIICSSKALIIGLPVAIVFTYLINLPIRSMFPIPYQFPWLQVLWSIIGVLAITWVTIRFSASRLRGRNIVEAIRSESGM